MVGLPWAQRMTNSPEKWVLRVGQNFCTFLKDDPWLPPQSLSARDRVNASGIGVLGNLTGSLIPSWVLCGQRQAGSRGSRPWEGTDLSSELLQWPPSA